MVHKFSSTLKPTTTSNTFSLCTIISCEDVPVSQQKEYIDKISLQVHKSPIMDVLSQVHYHETIKLPQDRCLGI
jgi:hypothetical protein